ncbi:MAG: hypothetical protein A3D92_21370 [Bacteroidetes bacterium RIFCSPHIGHO2_02_FULL_44_7]|nr:MAG: hypothetical protein A3D92_21370 [Bacteroidetes bacterium RIFCSPHIGHO2_02_FULL_44_7]
MYGILISQKGVDWVEDEEGLGRFFRPLFVSKRAIRKVKANTASNTFISVFLDGITKFKT